MLPAAILFLGLTSLLVRQEVRAFSCTQANLRCQVAETFAEVSIDAVYCISGLTHRCFQKPLAG